MSQDGAVLCRLQDLPEGASRGFSIETGGDRQELFVVRSNGRVWAYRNSCPHTGAPLDWVPDQFLNPAGDLIQCATHHALFDIETGICLAGPCVGRSLTPVPVTLEGDRVVLRD